MSPDPDAQLARVRALALQLPGTAERLSHGSPGFHIAKGKFFAYFWHNHHSDGETVAIVKTSGREEQQQLIENDPERYYRPAYFGDSWIGVRLDLGENDWDHIADWLQRSWRMSAPRKLTALLDAADAF